MRFILFKLQDNEIIHKYSFVTPETLKTIPKKIILGTKAVPKNAELTKELAEKFTRDILNANN